MSTQQTLGEGADQRRLAAAREALADAERVAGAPAGRGIGVMTGQGPFSGTAAAPASGTEEHQRARQIVLRQLAVGPRTRRQLADKLRDKDCPDEVARAVLDRMTEVGLVDDEAFAEMFVRSRQDTLGLAGTAIRHELRQKGVAQEIVDQALSEVTPEHERPVAEGLVARRLRTMRGLPREVQVRRLAGFLARKGYGAGVSYEVIRDALDEMPEHHRD